MNKKVNLIVVVLLVVLPNAQLVKFKFCLQNVTNSLNDALSPKCAQQIQDYIDNLSLDHKSWSLQMLDASSKLQSGIIKSLHLAELGDFNQCIQISTNKTRNGDRILGKYCLGNVENSTLFTNTNLPAIVNGTKHFLEKLGASPITVVRGLTWAVCLPDGCKANDATLLVGEFFKSCFQVQSTIKFNDFLCQSNKNVSLDFTTGAVVAIAVFSVLMAVVTISTFIDLYCHLQRRDNTYAIVTAFSAYTNCKTIFKLRKVTSEQLPCLDGLKFLSMVWIVIGHQFSFTSNGNLTNSNDLTNWANSWTSMFIVSGTLGVDTFLLAGGTLMSYGFLKARAKNQVFNLLKYYLHRYFRLTPSLALVTLFSATLLEYTGSGPSWPFFKLFFATNCKKYWWSTLLYVQNYVNVNELCVGQSWYLNVDMQLYFISPIIFFMLWKWTKCTVGLLVVAVFAICGVDFYIGWLNSLSAIPSNFYQKNNWNFVTEKYYLLTHTRASPWLIGVILGYIVFNLKHSGLDLKPKKIVVVIVWIMCLSTLLTCTFGGFLTLRKQTFDRIGNALHLAFVRPAWSLACAWLIFACITDNASFVNWFLSLNIYPIFNRFTYGIYLTHVTLSNAIIYSQKTPEQFSSFNTIYQFCGLWWFSTLFAFILVLVAEAPIPTLEKLLYGQLPLRKVLNEPRGVINLGFHKNN